MRFEIKKLDQRMTDEVCLAVVPAEQLILTCEAAKQNNRALSSWLIDKP
jgi:hypothetical protein